jgi:hypothetical protein
VLIGLLDKLARPSAVKGVDLLANLVTTLDRLICDERGPSDKRSRAPSANEAFPPPLRRARLASLRAIPAYGAALGAHCTDASTDQTVLNAFTTVATLVYDGRPMRPGYEAHKKEELHEQWEQVVKANPVIYAVQMREVARNMAGTGTTPFM